MIKLEDRFGLTKDKYQWILTHFYVGKDRKGNDKEQSKDTYHGNLDQVSNYILNTLSEKCETLEELKELYTVQSQKLRDLLK